MAVPQGRHYATQLIAGALTAHGTYSAARDAEQSRQELFSWLHHGWETVSTPPMPSRKRAFISDADQTYEGAQAPLHPSSRIRTPGVPRSVARAVQACCLQTRYLTDDKSSATVSAAGSVTCLNDLSQGTSDSTRLADQVQWTDLKMLVQVGIPATAAQDTYRLTVLLDRECFGNICTVGQVFANGTSGGLCYQLFNWPNRSRFVILFDKILSLTNRTTPGAGAVGDIHTLQLHIPLHFTTRYSGNAGTIGDIISNSLCYIEASQNGFASSIVHAGMEYKSA